MAGSYKKNVRGGKCFLPGPVSVVVGGKKSDRSCGICLIIAFDSLFGSIGIRAGKNITTGLDRTITYYQVRGLVMTESVQRQL
jgi:hypothetical protein